MVCRTYGSKLYVTHPCTTVHRTWPTTTKLGDKTDGTPQNPPRSSRPSQNIPEHCCFWSPSTVSATSTVLQWLSWASAVRWHVGRRWGVHPTDLRRAIPWVSGGLRCPSLWTESTEWSVYAQKDLLAFVPLCSTDLCFWFEPYKLATITGSFSQLLSKNDPSVYMSTVRLWMLLYSMLPSLVKYDLSTTKTGQVGR